MFPKYNFPLQEYTVIDGDTISVVLDMGWDLTPKDPASLFRPGLKSQGYQAPELFRCL
jgi:hypothetical protein